jgi:isopentenyl-diphosphate delta-isomerase
MREFHDDFATAATGTPSDDDALILVDESDRDVGVMDKARCHEGSGTLHRAFSILLFNRAGELLIQQRATGKRLWPSFWSNSVCSHPRVTESMEVATQRRLREELGVTCPLQFLFKFQYQAQFDATGAEHELCSVYIGRCNQVLAVNPEEIQAWRWIAPDELQAEIARAGGGHGDGRPGRSLTFTPWFLMEWARIWREHRREVASLLE